MPILFIYPVFELYSLFVFGSLFGLWALIGYILVSFIIGANLIRSAGLGALRGGSPVQMNQVPFQLLAGILIFIPGFLSDFLAILVIVPFFRRLILKLIISKFFKGIIIQQEWQSKGGFSNRSSDFDRGEERDVTPRTSKIDKIPQD